MCVSQTRIPRRRSYLHNASALSPAPGNRRPEKFISNSTDMIQKQKKKSVWEFDLFDYGSQTCHMTRAFKGCEVSSGASHVQNSACFWVKLALSKSVERCTSRGVNFEHNSVCSRTLNMADRKKQRAPASSAHWPVSHGGR